MTKEDIKNYKTLNFGSPVLTTDNAMVVHDTPLVLCLRLVHSFESKQSYGWKMGLYFHTLGSHFLNFEGS